MFGGLPKPGMPGILSEELKIGTYMVNVKERVAEGGLAQLRFFTMVAHC